MFSPVKHIGAFCAKYSNSQVSHQEGGGSRARGEEKGSAGRGRGSADCSLLRSSCRFCPPLPGPSRASLTPAREDCANPQLSGLAGESPALQQHTRPTFELTRRELALG